jgi:hypothetical protein|tara:strand:+ start:4095 stop:4268 length:174 start_codon:yes stop_codon:yes gene_type:complete
LDNPRVSELEIHVGTVMHHFGSRRHGDCVFPRGCVHGGAPGNKALSQHSPALVRIAD